MRNRHCQHCYDEGYEAGKRAGGVNREQASEHELVRISLTDEIRLLYDIPEDAVSALAWVEGDRILSILDWSYDNE